MKQPKIIRFKHDEKLDRLAIGLAHIFFRNGIVEDIHAQGKLSQADMKRLNKDVANNIASLLYMAKYGYQKEMNELIRWSMLYGHDWDPPEPKCYVFYD